MRPEMRGFGCVPIAGAALLLLSTMPAQAQAVPGGSYMQSCSNVRLVGDRLVADCRRTDGAWNHAALNVGGCVSGIANVNGWLTCDYVPGSGSSYDEHYRFPPYAGYGR